MNDTPLSRVGLGGAELIEAMARAMCAAEGTSQCAAICLSHSAVFNRGGKCEDAVRVHKTRAQATAAALRPLFTALLEENGRLRDEIDKQAKEEPPLGLLISMAVCLDHGFAAPDFGALDWRKPSVPAYQQRVLADMRKVWDEVKGRGYWRPERNADYERMIDTPKQE